MHVSRIESHIVHDIWTTDLRGSRLVLGTWCAPFCALSLTEQPGANKQAVVIEDIAASTSLRRLRTESDVFALAQQEV